MQRVKDKFENKKAKFDGQKVFLPKSAVKRVLNRPVRNASPKRSKSEVDDLLDSQQPLDSDCEDFPCGVFSQISVPPAFTPATQPMPSQTTMTHPHPRKDHQQFC